MKSIAADVAVTVLVLALTSTASASAEWVAANDGEIPAGAVVAGHEADGTPLYLCRARHQDGVHPGKVRPAFRACNVSFAGEELSISSYQVYVKWMPARGGYVPPGAVAAGHEADGAQLYICRAWFEGGLHPGKVRPGFDGCNLAWGGREVAVADYEVLRE